MLTRMPESGFRNQSADAFNQKGFTEPPSIIRAHLPKPPQHRGINLSSVHEYSLAERIKRTPKTDWISLL